MSIAQTRYIKITSGVGAPNSVARRDLITRLFTENPLVPTGTVLEFTSADDVGAYFGLSSVEYLRAQFYFSWISKNITQAQRISFSFWNVAASGSLIFGKPGTYALGSFTGVATGDFTLTLGGFTHHLTGIDLTGAGSLAAVAADIQTAIRAFSGGGTAWTAATVAFDATRGCFDLVSGTTGPDVISVTPGVTTDLASLLGWLTGAILSNGAAIQTITQTLAASAGISNNFGSIVFMPTLNQSQIVEAATWNATQNNMYQYSVPCTSANAAALNAALINSAGCELTLAPLSSEYPEMVPGMILAATDYDSPNSTQDYMYQVFALTASVTTDADADLYDGLRVNYYGQTQVAGRLLQFYQRGEMMGLPVDPVDMNVYANEQWLKDSFSQVLLGLLLALAKVSANQTGRRQILAQMQPVISQGVNNGTVSAGKILTETDILFITNATGDPNAWQQVQSIGYWLNCVIESFITPAPDDRTEYKAVYTFIYAKDDVIRKIEGSDVLI